MNDNAVEEKIKMGNKSNIVTSSTYSNYDETAQNRGVGRYVHAHKFSSGIISGWSRNKIISKPKLGITKYKER